ncbi:SKIP/SNW domain-containing protein, partial [Dimargaris cristalligena]
RTSNALTVTGSSGPPPYGRRQNWLPKVAADFADGGAFPEIHILQHPLGMGRSSGGAGTPLPLQVNAQGEIQYDAIVRQGHGQNRTVHAQFQDLVPLSERPGFNSLDTEALLDRPDADTIQDTTERTRLALEKITQGKLAAGQRLGGNGAKASNKNPQYIRYTPNQQNAAFNSGAKQRVVRMVEMPVDPFEPQRFKQKKIPRGPPSPPAPIMHSPPRKPTADEQRDWFIPPAISNWKNPKGFTIPLDKRLAADGRGLQEVQINDNFAKLTDALNAGERLAREGIRARKMQEQKLAQKEKDAKEAHLRALAQQAREARAGGGAAVGVGGTGGGVSGWGRPTPGGREDEDDQAYREREELRQEQRAKREREVRQSHMGVAQRAQQLAREQNRDLSEKIALGLAKPTPTTDSLFDTRLFNRSEGLDSGFKGDDTYNLYEKPLFAGTGASSIYRPTRPTDGGDGGEAFGGGNADTISGLMQKDRFAGNSGVSFRGFQGTEGPDALASASREGPVQFEKARTGKSGTEGGKPSSLSSSLSASHSATAAASSSAADVFGLDQFLEEAKRSKRPAGEPGSQSNQSKRSR